MYSSSVCVWARDYMYIFLKAHEIIISSIVVNVKRARLNTKEHRELQSTGMGTKS